jgi:hypothetical protein
MVITLVYEMWHHFVTDHIKRSLTGGQGFSMIVLNILTYKIYSFDYFHDSSIDWKLKFKLNFFNLILY